MKTIIALLGILVSFTIYAADPTPSTARKLVVPQDDGTTITVPDMATVPEAPKDPIDYSKRPVVHFEQDQWRLINDDTKQQAKFWANIVTIEAKDQNRSIVGMVEFYGERRYAGVGTQVSRVFGEAIIDCDKQIIYPIRDVYTTKDFHIVGVHNHHAPMGATSTKSIGTMGYALAKLACEGELVNAKEPETK